MFLFFSIMALACGAGDIQFVRDNGGFSAVTPQGNQPVYFLVRDHEPLIHFYDGQARSSVLNLSCRRVWWGEVTGDHLILQENDGFWLSSLSRDFRQAEWFYEEMIGLSGEISPREAIKNACLLEPDEEQLLDLIVADLGFKPNGGKISANEFLETLIKWDVQTQKSGCK